MGFATLAQLGLGFGAAQPIHTSGHEMSLCLQEVDKPFIPRALPTPVPAPLVILASLRGARELWACLWAQMGGWHC